MSFKLRFRTLFPASVTAASPLVLEKFGLLYSFSLDINELRQSLDPYYVTTSQINFSNLYPIVILATGQSNFSNTPDFTWSPPGNLKIWNWPGFDGTIGSAFVAPDSTKIGVTWRFAAEVAKENPLRPVYLINIAIPAQAIAQWKTGASSPDMFANIINNITPALAAANATTIDMLLWWQGESDAPSPANYVSDFEAVQTRFRAQSWFRRSTPVVVFGAIPTSSINPYLKECVRADSEFRCFVNIPTIPASSPYWADTLHMTGAGYDFAGRWAEEVSRHGAARAGYSDVRRMVSVATTFYVRTDGSDLNDGRANTAAGAFLTIQTAVNAVAALDLNGQTVTIQVADGTYTAGAILKELTGRGTVIIQGNTTTPSNCVISTTANAPFTSNVAGYDLRGFKTVVATSGYHITADGGSTKLVVRQWDFGAGVAGWAHLSVTNGASVQMLSNYTISGGAGYHWLANDGGRIQASSLTITLTGTPAFGTAFAGATRAGGVLCPSNTFSGSATGARYSVAANAYVETFAGGATYLPGNAAGGVTSGGQYN